MVQRKVNSVTEESTMKQPGMEMRFDLGGMEPSLFGNELRVEVPVMQFRSPILDHEAFEVMKEAGLDEREIEEAIDDMVAELQTRILAKMLMKRRMG